jgi:hypothetical protein
MVNVIRSISASVNNIAFESDATTFPKNNDEPSNNGTSTCVVSISAG